MNELNQQEKPNQAFLDWISESVTAKIGMIIILIGLLMLPITMIESLIVERQSTQSLASAEIKSKWGESQTFTGPVLTVPYTYEKITINGRIAKGIHYERTCC